MFTKVFAEGGVVVGENPKAKRTPLGRQSTLYSDTGVAFGRKITTVNRQRAVNLNTRAR